MKLPTVSNSHNNINERKEKKSNHKYELQLTMYVGVTWSAGRDVGKGRHSDPRGIRLIYTIMQITLSIRTRSGA